ncbi:MAG: hypothetical protein M1817_005914 [Caeruleum heppii]|nr:MAG: hypothetical protein M1817_005914 [Caeruleum heppii]
MAAVVEQPSRDGYGFDEHPSVSASLEDFAHDEPETSPRVTYASHHSGFRSEDGDLDRADSDSSSSYSPFGHRRVPPIVQSTKNWRPGRIYQQDPVAPDRDGDSISPQPSRESSPQYESAAEGKKTVAVSESARPPTDSESTTNSATARPRLAKTTADGDGGPGQCERTRAGNSDAGGPFLRLFVRAEVQQCQVSFAAIWNFMARQWAWMFGTWAATLSTTYVLVATLVLFQVLFRPPPPPPAPDLVKVAGLAKSFEPMIVYSEQSARQVSDIQQSGIAVWDLAETVRFTNMTSTAALTTELEGLGGSLSSLHLDLIRFFTRVNGDIDQILIVMDWAKRELGRLPSHPPSAVSVMYDNVHSRLCRVGLFETMQGELTPIGWLVTDIFGKPRERRSLLTLQRTFNEFVSVLEEAINNELRFSAGLFSLFGDVDERMLRIARIVIQESDLQEQEENDVLSSLWTRLWPWDVAWQRKYERNRLMLSTLRARTVRNKHMLVDHNGKLLTIKNNLDSLRLRLISPMVRSNDSSTLSIAEQIEGLDGTHQYLDVLRAQQRKRLMDIMFGARLGGIEEENLIDSGRSR